MRGPWPVYAVLAAACSAGSGCATGSATEEELSRLRRELRTVQSDLSATKQELQRIDGQLQLIASASRDQRLDNEEQRAARPGAAAASAATLPSLPVVRLSGPKPRGAAGKKDSDVGATEDGEAPIMIKVGPDSGAEKLSVDKAVLDKPDPVLSQKKVEKRDMSADYARALETLREKKQADEAIALFVSFLDRYPKSPLSDNARFWLGSARLDAGQNEQGIQELTKLVAERPASAKAADALLRVGEAWQKLGKASEAKEIFSRLIRDYPTSEAAKSAERLRDGAASGGR